MNAEFQRIAKRDKKAFFNEQCKEIEENNKKGKTRDLFKKTGDIKGIFHAKIKDRNGKDLIQAERLRRDSETQNCTKKILITQIATTVWSVTQSQTFWSVKSSSP